MLEVYEPTYTRALRRQPRRARRRPRRRRGRTARHAASATWPTGDGLPEGAFDCFICTQTLQLVPDVRARAARTPAAPLRRAACCWPPCPACATLPHGADEDFPDQWRFTAAGLRRLAADVFGADSVEVVAWGNVAVAAAFLYGLAEHEVDAGALHRDDPDYEVIIALRARRGPCPANS